MTKRLKDNADPVEYQRELGKTIGEVSRAWRHEMNHQLKPLGLNLSMRQVLMQLHRNPEGLIQRDLARRLGIEGPTLVRLLDLLERKDWIQRLAAPDDKRRKYSVLTPKAAEQIKTIEKLSGKLSHKMMKGLSAGEIESSLHVMRRIRDNLVES
ncbi:MAG: transcriptional regulator, MarR family [Herminiimonas sp.]|jgi:MarR family transcriptional regulator for hemolysin|nr:transcriptional regulator, MarR family [Herminiimonas sp.]